MTETASTATVHAPTSETESASPFLRACRGLAAEHTPIWLMRQAGRYMAEYQAVRAQHSMLDVIRTPELAAQITLQPIDRFGFDAAIIFSDILPPLIGMGLKLDFVKGSGPSIDNPLRTNYDIDMLATPTAEEHLSPTLDAIRLVAAELRRRGSPSGCPPLIGFAGAPFTLASYAVEGGGSKNYARVKALMYSEPAAWKRLMTKLVTVQADYLVKQAHAGASALQVFDSWAGLALGREDYVRFVQPYNRMLFTALQRSGVPVINFSTGTSAYLADVAEAGGDVLGVDWRMPLGWCWEQINFARPIQGNLDPVALLAPWRELKYQVDGVLAQAASPGGSPLGAASSRPFTAPRPGHIFNLGHGILPQTPCDNVRRLVDYVHETTRTGNAAL